MKIDENCIYCIAYKKNCINGVVGNVLTSSTVDKKTIRAMVPQLKVLNMTVKKWKSLWEKQFSSLKKYLICTYPWVSKQLFKIRTALNYRRSCDGLFNVQSTGTVIHIYQPCLSRWTQKSLGWKFQNLNMICILIQVTLLHVIITPNLCNVMLG